MSTPRIAAVILAAGKGTRLKSDLPKVLHEVCGRPMLAWVLDACREAGIETRICVVGHGMQRVLDAFEDEPGVEWVEQAEQLGTGHAVMVCREKLAGRFDHAVICCGDGPLVRPQTLRTLLERHLEAEAVLTLATAELDDPTGYGRILRDEAGRLVGIVEERDCTDAQRAIREINPSYYAFRVPELFEALERIDNNNAKGEYYLTDTVGVLISLGRTVQAVTAVPAEDVLGINSRRDLARVNAIMRDRINARWMDAGVTLVDPATTWIDPRATIGRDTVIEPCVTIEHDVEIGRDCRIGPLVYLPAGSRIADGSVVSPQQGVCT